VLHDWSVRRLEEASREQKAAAKPAKSVRTLAPELEELQGHMREALGLKTVLTGTEKKGKIVLSYNSAQELEHLYEAIGRLLD